MAAAEAPAAVPSEGHSKPCSESARLSQSTPPRQRRRDRFWSLGPSLGRSGATKRAGSAPVKKPRCFASTVDDCSTPAEKVEVEQVCADGKSCRSREASEDARCTRSEPDQPLLSAETDSLIAQQGDEAAEAEAPPTAPPPTTQMPLGSTEAEAAQAEPQAAPAPPPRRQMVVVQQPPRVNFYLGGDALELMVAPGDVLLVQGGGRLGEIGRAGGFMGHVMLVVAAPRCMQRHTAEPAIRDIWPSGQGVTELWRIRTVESTRRESGLWESDALVYIDRRSRRMMLCGEITVDNEVSSSDPEAVEVWQSPEELRAELRVDLMKVVLGEMREGLENWCLATGLKAVFKAASVTMGQSNAQTLEELKACWTKPPICTSVVIGFWQRYFEKLAAAAAHEAPAGAVPGVYQEGERVAYFSESRSAWVDAVVVSRALDPHGRVIAYNLDVKPVVMPSLVRRHWQIPAGPMRALDLIMKYMPLKADRSLPGDLVKTMRECDWIGLPQIPRSFRQGITHVPPMQIPLEMLCPQKPPAMPEAPEEAPKVSPERLPIEAASRRPGGATPEEEAFGELPATASAEDTPTSGSAVSQPQEKAAASLSGASTATPELPWSAVERPSAQHDPGLAEPEECTPHADVAPGCGGGVGGGAILLDAVAALLSNRGASKEAPWRPGTDEVRLPRPKVVIACETTDDADFDASPYEDALVSPL